MPRSFRSTIVRTTVATMTVAMVLVVLGIQLVLDRTAQRDIRQVLEDRSQAMITVIEQASTTRLTVPADALEPGIAVYDDSGQRIAGSVESTARAAADDLGTTTTTRAAEGPTDDDRLLGTPFTTPSGDTGVLVVSQEAEPYERSELYALIATIVLGVLVIGATAVIALRVTSQALRPVSQMAERAADWSEHDLTHRFGLGPPTNELAALGETLDHLLDRVAAAIRSEQRLTSELAHELRTPLTAIQGSADLALLRGVDDDAVREDLRQISASARDMAGVIATLLDIARDGTTTGREQACTIADVVPGLLAAAGADVEVLDRTDGSTARVAAPAALVVRAVSPVVDNAARHARSQVVLGAVDHHDRVDLLVRDDGDGVDPALRERLFEPGASSRGGGAGLGLGIARRVARSLGGEVELDRSDAGGTTFRVSLPRG
ncbi:signal transduction histidine kinase [Nocardioides sp. BE266]|uniref:sensor histidine kinase n=1 Tax=Nocardioides sp. BE266 TaxID=2817725 RepID=UPI00285F1728|nr:HAMP domain-containing sensor histidine kinase [Nocardioides sp. BE266]MDR7254784.1 signal transduction histidine kinase [Nocardioides sp. BE266]